MSTTKTLLAAVGLSLSAAAVADQDRVAAALHQGHFAVQYLGLTFDSQGGGNDSLEADFAGFEGGMTLTPRILGFNVYFQPRLLYAFGGDDEEYWQVGASLGLSLLAGPEVVLTPHVDLDGYRIQLAAPEGERTYSHLGYGGGLRIDYAPTERFALTLDATVQRMGRAEVERAIPQAFGGGDITLGLDNDWQWRATVQGSYLLNPRLGVFGRYQYTSFDYGQSNPNSLVVEEGQEVSGNSVALGVQLTF